MWELKIANFKAFGKDEVVFGGKMPDGKPMNILCYGENGTGKSSAYEAIKYVFHKQRIEQERVAPHLQGVARENAKRQILIDYKHKSSDNPAFIAINNQVRDDFDASSYNVYMIESRNLAEDGHIDIRQLLKSMYLGKHDIDAEVTEDFFDAILEETNRVLKECFFEDIQLNRSRKDPFWVNIDDVKQGLHYDEDLCLHFNEAKLHLVNLLLALSSITLLAPSGADKKRMLVLDDFITSLDTSNRTFLYQYIVSCFKNFQVVIFTHNTSFYNLCDHFLKEDADTDKIWLRQGIYEYNYNHYVYAKANGSRIDIMRKELEEHPERVTDIGNDVRQYFEVLLHQFALMLMAGAKEETSKVLKEVSNKSNNRIFHIDEHGINDLRTLFQRVNQIMNDAPEDKQWEKVKKAINDFNNTTDSADKLSDNLRAMAIYQKVALHQSSHGHEGLPDLSAKEIKASLHVLEKLENTIKKMKIERI